MSRGFAALGVVLILLAATSTQCVSSGKQKAPVDVTHAKRIDVTGDGRPESVVLNYRGANWHEPFTWTLRITAEGRLLFEHSDDDAWMDEFFADENFLGEGLGYLKSKRKYYNEEMLQGLFCTTGFPSNDHAFDPKNSGSIHVVAANELKEKHSLSDEEARRVVAWMMERLKAFKAPLLYVPISAVHCECPRMWVPQVEDFITVYQW